jgi:hypothetical protein
MTSPNPNPATAITPAAATAVSPAPTATVSRVTAARQVSPKVNFAALGAAIATIFWSIAAATWWKNAFSAATLAALTGATATVLSFGLGYWKSDALREDGGQ